MKRITVSLFLLAGLSGCASIGPGNVARDRFDYISAISDSWKAQMLLNLVKLRYGDAPVFLDVASVITQTGLQGTVAVSGTWWQNILQLPFTSNAGVTAAGTYGEKPTVTYLADERGKVRPQSDDADSACGGSKFSPGRLSGQILCCGSPCIPSMAYIAATAMVHARARPIPSFIRSSRSCADIQQSGEIGLRVKKTGNQAETLIVFGKKPRPGDSRRIAPRCANFSVSILRPTSLAWSTARWPPMTKRLPC